MDRTHAVYPFIVDGHMGYFHLLVIVPVFFLKQHKWTRAPEAGAFLLGDILTWVSEEVLTHRFGEKKFRLS